MNVGRRWAGERACPRDRVRPWWRRRRGEDESGTTGAKMGAGVIHHESHFRVCLF